MDELEKVKNDQIFKPLEHNNLRDDYEKIKEENWKILNLKKKN